MINNQTDDKIIKLTPEQTASLEEYQVRLSNILSEILNHNKILKGLKSECDRSVSQKAYQEQLLAEISPKVIEKTAQINALNEEINNATTNLSKLQVEIRTKAAEQTEKDTKFQSKSDDLDKIIKEYNTKVISQAKDQHKLEEDLLNFNQKVAKLKEVIKDF